MTTGIVNRNRRTKRLWRRAARNTRALSVRPRDAKARVARSSTCGASAFDMLCDMMVKRLTPQPVPVADRAAQIASQFLANPTGKIAGKCGPAAAYPLELP